MTNGDDNNIEMGGARNKRSKRQFPFLTRGKYSVNILGKFRFDVNGIEDCWLNPTGGSVDGTEHTLYKPADQFL